MKKRFFLYQKIPDFFIVIFLRPHKRRSLNLWSFYLFHQNRNNCEKGSFLYYEANLNDLCLILLKVSKRIPR